MTASAKSTKRYYWIKLKQDFFGQKEIKKLRKLPGGDTLTIIFLKLQLLSLNDNGIIYFDGLEKSFEEEIALEIDEEPDNVRFTISYLLQIGWIEESNTDEAISYNLVKIEVGSFPVIEQSKSLTFTIEQAVFPCPILQIPAGLTNTFI